MAFRKTKTIATLFDEAISNGNVIVRSAKSTINSSSSANYSNQEALINGTWIITNRVSLSDAAKLFNQCSLATIWGFKKVATDFNNWHLEPEPNHIEAQPDSDELLNSKAIIAKLNGQISDLQAILASAKEEEPALINRVTLQYINDSRREKIDSAKEEARLEAEKNAEQQADQVRKLLNY
ncbi:hypothetical protein [Thalassotalea sp. ND16A]|uniref:hypothetical protein n=1 Tax=Thalassotalea sp. ND16A TaxID=1535422 RepID=UPI00051D424F|nr:hypothetical protein [Thalassotalea sp. ND16A]KGJ89451.1 hypothetical protein ND16A_2344 [Thalassotalea sp. ND16A]